MANNIDKKEPVAICDQSQIDVTKCDNHELAGNIEPLMYMKILNTRILKKSVGNHRLIHGFLFKWRK